MASIQPLGRDGKPLPRGANGRPVGKADRYKAWYRDATGRNVGRVSRTKREAERFIETVAHQRVQGTLLDTKVGRQTFGDLWAEVQAVNEFAPKTQRTYETVWRLYAYPLKSRPIGEITESVIGKILEGISAQSMREKTRSILHTVFEHAIAHNRIARNPAKAKRQSTTRAARIARMGANGNGGRNVSLSDLKALVAALPDPRYAAMVRLMSNIGLRPGEAAALRVGKIDLDRRRVHIDGSREGPTKTGVARDIPLPAVVAEYMADHIRTYSNPSDPEALVFTSPSGRMLAENTLGDNIRRASKRAKVEYVKPNDLRHSAVAYAIARGANIFDVQRMVGHGKPSITLDVYGYLFDQSGTKLGRDLDRSIREDWR